MGGTKPGSLSTIVGSFKSAATQQINVLRQTPGAAQWQRSFHDWIIRNEREWDALRGYIFTNPARWAEDRFYGEA